MLNVRVHMSGMQVGHAMMPCVRAPLSVVPHAAALTASKEVAAPRTPMLLIQLGGAAARREDTADGEAEAHCAEDAHYDGHGAWSVPDRGEAGVMATRAGSFHGIVAEDLRPASGAERAHGHHPWSGVGYSMRV